MADHKQDNKRTITPDDRRIILNSIDPNWDSKNKCYLVGWSDARISKDLGVDVSWVKESRELVYGGVGEDPQLEHLLAGYISAQAEMDEIQKSEREHDVAMLELRASVSNLEKHVNQNKEKITKLNDFLQGHAKIVAALTGQKKVG